MKTASTLILLSILTMTGCGKDYIIHRGVDAKGNQSQVITTTIVEDSNWSWIFGHDVSVVYPAECPATALDWKGRLDKEQCTLQHDHLTGPNKGQTRYVHTVHANDTIGKKVLPFAVGAAIFAGLSNWFSGDNSATANQSNNTNVTQNNTFQDNILPGGGHGRH